MSGPGASAGVIVPTCIQYVKCIATGTLWTKQFATQLLHGNGYGLSLDPFCSVPETSMIGLLECGHESWLLLYCSVLASTVYKSSLSATWPAKIEGRGRGGTGNASGLVGARGLTATWAEVSSPAACEVRTGTWTGAGVELLGLVIRVAGVDGAGVEDVGAV